MTTVICGTPVHLLSDEIQMQFLQDTVALEICQEVCGTEQEEGLHSFQSEDGL